MQVFPLNGIVIVSSPQALALMVVRKAINVARALNVPLLALIKNMSYVACPHCGKEIRKGSRSFSADGEYVHRT